jgi:phospholipase C
MSRKEKLACRKKKKEKEEGKMNKKLAVSLLFFLIGLESVPAFAQTFSHVIVIVQENRSPDNLF